MAAMSFLTLFYKAQTQAISFEGSEGYAVGNLSGQQGWTTWGGLPVANAKVVAANATDGANSFSMSSAATVQQACGIEKDITTLATGMDIEISFDYRFSALNFSDYEIAVYNSTLVSDYTAAFRINHVNGNVSYKTETVFVNGPDIIPNQYYNFKIVIKKSNDTIEYFLDGASLYSGALGVYKNAQVLDFLYDDFGSGFNVDNIQITNLASLSTQEAIKKNEIRIFPNPAAENVFIESSAKIQSVQIMDTSGRILKSLAGKGNNQQIPITDLSKGVYLIKVKTDTSDFSKKLIKK